MKQRMQEYAAHLDYENAQNIKEQIIQLENAQEKQVAGRIVAYDQAVIYFSDNHVLSAYFKRGALQGMNMYDLDTSINNECSRENFNCQIL